MKENYQKKLVKIIDEIKKKDNDVKPTLLLHTCCAPCSSYCLEYLSDFFDITVYYYNPNISEKAEFEMREKEQKRLIDELNKSSGNNEKIHFISGEYEPDKFFEKIKGLEKCPEGGDRCKICFEMRLAKTLETALKYKSDYFTTSLTISPLKNAQLINEIGMELAQNTETQFLNSDFKKNDGYKRSIELSQKFNLYRQDFCGCIYSKLEMEKKRNEKNN